MIHGTWFVDDRSFTVERYDKVVLKANDGRKVVIDEMLYLLGLKTNMLSLGELFQKEFMMKIEDNCHINFDENKRLIILTYFSYNRTFPNQICTNFFFSFFPFYIFFNILEYF